MNFHDSNLTPNPPSFTQDFDPEFGSVKIGGGSSRGRASQAVSEAVAGARRPGRRERKFTSDEIKKYIEDAEVSFGIQ